MKKILLTVLLLCAGCRTIDFNHPDDINEMCYDAKHKSKAKIEAHDYELKEKKSAKVVKHDGDERISGIWCWRDPKLGNGWIGGLCWDTTPIRIEVGCNPITKGDVSFPITEHEYGHYWLISNYRMFKHTSIFSNDFYNWYEVRPTLMILDDGTKVLVDFIE